jgi:putative endonuclease
MYINEVSDFVERIKRHNSGSEKTTKPYAPFKLIYSERQPDRKSAKSRE